MMRSEWIDCDCSSAEHAIQLVYDDEIMDDGWVELCLSARLRQWRPWYKRIWTALMYALGKDTCPYGEYDSFLFSPRTARKFSTLLDLYLRQKSLAKASNLKEAFKDEGFLKKLLNGYEGERSLDVSTYDDSCTIVLRIQNIESLPKFPHTVFWGGESYPVSVYFL